MIDIDEIIEQAVRKDATDIHLVLESKPIYRIGNALVKMEGGTALKYEDMNEICNYFSKRNDVLNKNENKTMDTIYEFNGINLGINLSFANKKPVYTMKILKNELPQYEELSLPDELRAMTYQTQGLILIAGNKKSGKTTTLNALVRHINETQNKKIITLEKRIEYTHMPRNSLIIQKEVGNNRDFSTYSEGISNALREDCDILVVEDIRNRETMEQVLQLVEEGHLVIAGINTKTCTDAIKKIINFYDVKNQNQIKYSLSELLKIIISQKLLLGTNGKLELLSEMLIVNNKLREIIKNLKTDVIEIEKYQKDEGTSLIDSLAKLYLENKITLKQAKSFIGEKEFDILNNTIMKMRVKN